MPFPIFKNQAIFLILVILLISVNPCASASKNDLLDRTFWKSKPSLVLVKTKIAQGHNPSELNSNAFDPVVYSILEESTFDVIEYLILQKGNGFNKITHDGRNYLFWAAYKNNLDLVNHLILKGSNSKLIDDHGNTVINFVAGNGNKNIALYDLLVENGAEPAAELNPKGANALHLLIAHLEDSKMIEYFMGLGVDLFSTDKDGNGLFNYAARGGNLLILEWLIRHEVPFKNLNTKGENAFFWASLGMRRKTNSLDVFQYLTNKGINPSLKSFDGSTALINLCKGQPNTEVVKFLIQSGADVNQSNTAGNNALIAASKRANIQVIKILAGLSSTLNSANKKGETALFNALAKNTPEVCNFLISAGCSLDSEDAKGNNILYYWIQSYSPKDSLIFRKKQELLKKVNFNFSKPQPNNSNLFHLAVQENSLFLVKEALALNADINILNFEGLSPLHLAALQAKDEKILNFLIEHGAIKNLETTMGETAYDLALENELLQTKGISLNFLMD